HPATGRRTDPPRVEPGDGTRSAAPGPTTAATADASTELPGDATLQSTLTFSRRDGVVTISSALRGGFDAFRVEVEGVVVADLEWGLNVQSATGAGGWTVVTSRLDPSLQIEDAVLFGSNANVIVAQRARDGTMGEQRFALLVPLQR